MVSSRGWEASPVLLLLPGHSPTTVLGTYSCLLEETSSERLCGGLEITVRMPGIQILFCLSPNSPSSD